MELLDMEGSEPALAIVLCGFGGVGKSTLAASTIQSLNLSKLGASQDLNFCRVIINYKTPERESHIIELQQYIITAFGGYKIKLQNPVEGRKELQHAMENKFCLLYIDNVVDKEYIRQLLPKDLLWFNKSDSSMENLEKQKTKLRILVTSREKNLKPEFNINCKEYEVHAFSDDAAEELLIGKILHSHGQISVDFDERSLMTSVARACRAVPLILSVFGNHLRVERGEGVEQAKQSYREAIEVLEKGNLDSFRDEDISESLFFVYHKLRDEEDKDAFLDICKYFCGWEWNLVGNIVDPSRLQSLHRRMLVNKSNSGEVIVHDILRLMGVKEAKQTRISNYTDFSEVFEDGEANLQTVKGISLVSDKSQIKLELKHLDAVCHSLRVLMIGDWVKIDGLPCRRVFKNLRYLSVGDVTDFPFEDASKLQKLTVFFNKSKHGMNLHRLSQSLKFLSQEVADPDCHSLEFEILPLQSLHSLQNFIVRTRKPVKFPKEFHLPSSIVHLQLNCCSQLPKEFGNLTALESLILDKCDLESLPQGFGKLKKLKHLSMEYCTKLTSLPEELGLLSSLTSLRLHGCTLLEKLPIDLGKLSAMEELSMGECGNLRELPQDFGGLSSLQKLDLTGCISLQRLPESFGKLLIESLTLRSLLNLSELPESTGNMPRLTHLKLISCNSLTTFPNSFVHLSSLETLEINSCNKLVALPRDFGQLSSLQEMAVRSCPKLEEVPHGFQALPALKSFTLSQCSSLLNLPAAFGELICLEILNLQELPISCLPDGFGKLRRLEKLDIYLCQDLETLPGDFESLASLSRLRLWSCTKLDAQAMKKIVKLKLCYWVIIAKSFKLIEWWDEMREQEEYPMAVSDGIRRGQQLQHLLLAEGIFSKDEEELCRAAKAGLLGARCVQLDSTTQRLTECPTSILFEVDTTVAVIALPIHMEDHHHRLIERFIGVVMEKTELASSGHLQIVYVKRIKQKGEMTETEKQEEECFRQILMSMPKGSCCIPSTDMRCHRLITFTLFESRSQDLYPVFDYTADNKLGCRVLKVLVNNKGNKILQFNNFFGEDEIFGVSLHSSESVLEEHEISNSNGNFIDCICSGKLPGTAGLSRSQVDLDQLKGNVVGIFICDRNTHEYEKFHNIYKELRDRSFNFQVLWISLSEHEFYGLGTYTRAIQKMAWTALPDPNLVKVQKREPHLIIFDQEGSVVNARALSPMMSWGAEAYTFSQSKISEIVSTMQVEFSLNFLFNKINSVDKEGMKNKLIFLYAEPLSEKLEIKFKLDQLVQLHGNFEVIYVEYYFHQRYDMPAFKEIYEDEIKSMNWPKLSFEDMVTFWYRCKYLLEEMKDQSNLITEEFKILLEALYFEKGWLVVLDSDGVVTRNGYEMVRMICEKNDEERGGVRSIMENELLESLKLGKCNQVVRTYFADRIVNHPDHSQHHLVISSRLPEYVCNLCYYNDVITWDGQWRYRCDTCDWDLCKNCWKSFVKRQMQDLFLAQDMDN